MEELLTEEGYRAIVSLNTAEAYKIILREHPDIVILDIPIMAPDAAWTMVNMLHLNPVTRSIPILICSTNTQLMREAISELQAIGCETLSKPFQLEAMVAKIRKLLGAAATV